MSLQKYQILLQQHQKQLEQCTLCPNMFGPPVHGLPIVSKVMLIGQAPGFKEIEVLRPFAWTAGKKLFSWFEAIGMNEQNFRQRIYMSAICRCYPGKKPANSARRYAHISAVSQPRSIPEKKQKTHGDRVPDKEEIERCAQWLQSEIDILKPELIILVGKLAINQFMTLKKLTEVIGRTHTVSINGYQCDAIPLPHPSGASTWPLKEPGKTLLQQAMAQIEAHPAWQKLI